MRCLDFRMNVQIKCLTLTIEYSAFTNTIPLPKCLQIPKIVIIFTYILFIMLQGCISLLEENIKTIMSVIGVVAIVLALIEVGIA